ncbi:ADP-ribosylglycohydrolase family protein, partial [Streptomyces sp. NPDC003697]
SLAHALATGRAVFGHRAVAAACTPGATPDSVVAACLSLAKDGTRAAIEAVCETAARHTDFESALDPLREAVAPFDTVGPDYRSPSLGARRPSRLHAVEELPVALGMLVVSGGDFRHAVLGAVNYGRDCDSIATMAGALAGALGCPVPAEWATTVAQASRLDLWEPARTLAGVTREVFARDVRRRRAHEEAFARIGGTACSG